MDYFEIGQRIRKIRKARGLSQEYLAEKADISVPHMSHIETGNTKLSLPVLVAISDALSVRVDDLIYGVSPYTASSALDDIASILQTCTPQQARCIADIAKAAKQAFDRNL